MSGLTGETEAYSAQKWVSQVLRHCNVRQCPGRVRSARSARLRHSATSAFSVEAYVPHARHLRRRMARWHLVALRHRTSTTSQPELDLLRVRQAASASAQSGCAHRRLSMNAPAASPATPTVCKDIAVHASHSTQLCMRGARSGGPHGVYRAVNQEAYREPARKPLASFVLELRT